MGKSHRDNLFRYVKAGRLKRIRSYLKKHEHDLNWPDYVDKRGRTLLHIACLLGEVAIVKVLVQHGAKIEVQDENGNTPLHLAFRYALQVLEKPVYGDLVVPLLHQSRGIIDLQNDDGDTPRILRDKFNRELRRKRDDREVYEAEQELQREEKQRAKEWNEKMFFELGNDNADFSRYADREDQSSQETYDDWAERITREKYQKHHKNKRTKQNEQEAKTGDEKERQARERTRQLEEEYEAYRKEMVGKRTHVELAGLKSDYDARCITTFDSNTSEIWTFNDVPWPCQGSADDMVKMISKWSYGEQRKKYLRDEQVRWHPDRFLQKCGDRLRDDREKIVDYVNQLSQGINVLIDDEQ